MANILINTRQIGKILRYARVQNHLSLIETAKFLRISKTDLRQFERGTKIISESVMMRIMLFGIMYLKKHNSIPENKI